MTTDSPERASTALHTGSILIENGAVVPSSLLLDRTPYWKDWASVTNLNRSELGKEIHKAGWTCFYMAGEITATVCGFDQPRMVRTAVHRVIEQVQGQGCNCLEITQVRMKSFLGVPYVTVSAHSRHIQEAIAFCRH